MIQFFIGALVGAAVAFAAFALIVAAEEEHGKRK